MHVSSESPHQGVDQAEGGLAESGNNGVRNPVAQARLDEASSKEVGNGNEPSVR